MSLLRASLRQSNLICASFRHCRTYATNTKPIHRSIPSSTSHTAVGAAPSGVSSCVPNTVLSGMNYLKGQEPVLALPDEEYPPWLWTLLEPKVLPDDGPGGKAEKVRLRKENRQRIRDQNLLKTQ